MNNLYLFLTNFSSLLSSRKQDGSLDEPIPSSPSSVDNAQKKSQGKVVNKEKVFYGMIWYIGSLFGYFLMEIYH
jgi:hypothetical protein